MLINRTEPTGRLVYTLTRFSRLADRVLAFSLHPPLTDESAIGVCNAQTVGPVNCGNPGEFTMLELAEKVLAKVDSNSKLTFHPLPGDDPKQRKPDITLAKKYLDWEPKVALDEGLEKAIGYFKKAIK